MAKRTVVTLTDDIEGTPIQDGAGETLHFTFDGASYEIDLLDKNAKKMRNALQFYIDHGRRGGTEPPRPPSRSSPIDTKTVRIWAKNRGIEVNARGRVSQDVVDQFKAAGN